MTAIGETNFLQALGWAVLNSLWQMALLWVIYQLITGIFRKASASSRSFLASTLLILGFGWFIFTFLSILFTRSADEMAVSSGFASISGNEQLTKWLHQTLPLASIMYLLLLLLPILHFIRNYRYVQIIRFYGLSKANVEWRMFVKKVADRMGIKKPVHIWVSELVSSPVTIGYLKPVILVPFAAINNLTTEQLEAVLLHELSHIRRYDYLINLFINFIQTILYFNPFVKALVKTVEREREKSCDEMVMQFQYDPHDYASALMMLEKRNDLPKAFAVAASGKKNDLLHRVEFILGVQKKPVISFNKLAGLFAGLLCVIALNAFMILSRPSKGNKELAFNQLPSPFYFFAGDKTGSTIAAATPVKEITVAEHPSLAVVNHAKPEKPKAKTKRNPDLGVHTDHSRIFVNNPGFITVSFEPIIAPPVLKKYQEVQVKAAMEASKKVIEDRQWKVVEKKIADVLTVNVKQQIRLDYQAAMEKFDWKKLEDKLRFAYDKVDWETINDQLGKAMNRIRLDSIQKAYNEASANLDLVLQQLYENDLKGIPDTDITLKSVEQKKLSIQNVLSNLRAVRTKKTVHL